MLKNLRLSFCLLLASVLCVVSVAPPAAAAAAELTIVGDGGATSEFRILHAAQAPSSVRNAARELKTYLAKSTGADLAIVASDEAPAGPVISLGETVASKAQGLETASIGAEGYRIVTRDGNLFILGPDTPDGQVNETGGVSTGTLNGVYAFLEEHVGVRWLMPGPEGEDVPKLARLTLDSIDKTEAPVFTSRRLPYIQENRAEVKQWLQRMRQGRSLHLNHGHYWKETIPPELFEKHPEWFAEMNGVRVPPIGRYKLETTNPDLQKAYAQKAIEAFKADPNLYCYSLSPSDSRGWSTSAESKALYETDPHGNLSTTRMILSFYNSVARHVRQEMPDRIVAGYIYADYLYPSPTWTEPLEPNLFLVVAPSFDYGYTLYRPEVQKQFDAVMGGWSAIAGQLGFYDLPTNLSPSAGYPLAPGIEILQFIYPRLPQHKVKSVYVYGSEGWGGAALGNYLKAKLNWNPQADVRALAAEYCDRAYGPSAGPIMLGLFDQLDAAFKAHYQSDPAASYSLTPKIIKGVYVELYPKLESAYLQARAAAAAEPKHLARLELFERTLVVLQADLRQRGLLDTPTTSALYRSDEQLETMLRDPASALALADAATPKDANAPPLDKLGRVAERTSGAPADAPAPQAHLLRGAARFDLHAAEDEQAIINCVKLNNGNGEIVRYLIRDDLGKTVASGVLKEKLALTVDLNKGQNYFLDVQARSASYQLSVTGCGYAVRSIAKENNGLHLLGKTTTLYCYVPAGATGVALTLHSAAPGETAAAEVRSPSGTVVGRLDTTHQPAARIDLDTAGEPAGHWTIVFTPPGGGIVDDVWVKVDGTAPWFGMDPQHLLDVELSAGAGK